MELNEIAEFQSPGEFTRFNTFLSDWIEKGELKEIPNDPSYHAGEIYGGRWFEVVRDKTIWRLIPPDPPFTGLFERVVNSN